MRRPFCGMSVLLMLACADAQVTWNDVVYDGGPPEPREKIGVTRPLVTGCGGSMRIASMGELSFAAWWDTRIDSSVVLLVSRSLDGGSWSEPVIADSSDHGTRGCRRPPPAISVDPVSRYVHLAYFLEPPAGGGVFFAHSMDSGATFHAPVPIVYGRLPSRTSVASRGDRVVVAYEDPNSERQLIGIALSKTMGHTFETRVPATSENSHARQPVVRVSGDSVRLWWSEYSANPAMSATRPRYRAAKWN